MKYLKGFIQATTWFNERLGRWFISSIAFAFFVIIMYEMTARYVFDSPTIWATELAQMLFGAYIILSGGYLLVHRAHLNVDIFYGQFSVRTKATVDIITSVLFFSFLMVLLVEGWALAEDAIARWERSHSAWNPPTWPLKLAVPVGGALLFLQGVCKLIQDVATVIDPGIFAEESAKEERDFL